MDYYVNSKTEEETIYEIYKACRLCGAGAGYKMPIIQNVVNISTDEIELKQKIRECVQIEVHQDDKMPPLICELCVDKVNDFYEFMDMCKQTNKKTRLRLGLPPQTLPCGTSDAGDCILGVTEPVYINENSNEAILTRKSKTAKNAKSKKEPEAVKVESKLPRRDELKPSNISNTSTRSGRTKAISPPRLRGTKRQSDDDVSLSRFQKVRKPDGQGLKSILKKVTIDDSHLETRHKRSRDSISRETIKSEANKKVKISLNIDNKSSKTEAKSSKTNSTRSPPLSHKCLKCKTSYKSPQALANHMRIHRSNKVHKRMASPPPARNEGNKKSWCSRCSKCQKTILTNTFNTHKCSKRTWDCGNCKRKLQTPQALASHQKSCKTSAWDCGNCKRKLQTPQALASHQKSCKTSEKVRVPRKWMSMVRPLQVRISRCDSLLDDKDCCDAFAVPHDFGLDKNCKYPYLNMSVRKLRIKSELAAYDSMVNIQDEIRDEFDLDECYVHWDSESEIDSDIDISASNTHVKTNNVKSLSTLSLKVIYSPKLLGKVPKKLRKLRSEKPFESIPNVNEIDNNMRRGIDNIIDSLEDKSSDNISKTIEDDFLFSENKGPGVKNSDFDSIFNNHDSTNGDNKNLNKREDDKVYPPLHTNEVDGRLKLNSEISDENCKSSFSITIAEKLDVNKSIINKDESCNNDANSETSGSNILDHDSILSGESVNINEYDNTNSKIDIGKKMIECYKSSETNNSVKSENSKDDTTNNIVDKEIIDAKTNENNELEKESITRKCSEDRIENKLNMEIDINEKHSPVNEEIVDEPKAIKNTVDTDSIEGNDIKADAKDEKQVTDSKNHDREIMDNYCKNTDNESVNHKLECDDGQESIKTRISENEEDIKNENNKTFEASKVIGDSDVTDKFNMDDLEDLSDTDMDDKKLMDALDAQIGESDTRSIDATGTDTNK